MFQLLFERRHRVLLTRLSGTYVLEDIVRRDRAAARFVARHGLVRGLMDFSEVDDVDIPIDRLVRRAHEPPMLPGQMRVIVAPRPLTYELNRVVIAHQLYSRKVEPLLVRSLAQAYSALGMADPEFSPIEAEEADHLDDSIAVVLARMSEVRPAATAEGHDERQRLREKLTHLLEGLPHGSTPGSRRFPEPSRMRSAITLSDVFNAVLKRTAVSDHDLAAVCSTCRRKTTLGLCKVVTGRETCYHCPRCERVLTTLSLASKALPELAGKAYRLGAFLVRTEVDLDVAGARLPRIA